MWKRQELLNLPLRYEDELTEAGVIEGRLKRRLREEIHDRLRQGFIKAWATPSDGSPERLIDPPEWGKMEIDFDDRELDAIPWPFGVTNKFLLGSARMTREERFTVMSTSAFRAETYIGSFPLDFCRAG